MSSPTPQLDPTSPLRVDFVSTVNPKGNVTIPLPVRRFLKVKPQDKVVFRIQGQTVALHAIPMTLQETFGSVSPIHRPENFSELRAIALEEHAQKVINASKP
jgi:bifunctional DNA-binding transcriptional regulator/antitoxin component of YhaV-PrlF toxin-antitoxin module